MSFQNLLIHRPWRTPAASKMGDEWVTSHFFIIYTPCFQTTINHCVLVSHEHAKCIFSFFSAVTRWEATSYVSHLLGCTFMHAACSLFFFYPSPACKRYAHLASRYTLLKSLPSAVVTLLQLSSFLLLSYMLFQTSDRTGGLIKCGISRVNLTLSLFWSVLLFNLFRTISSWKWDRSAL